MRRKSILLLLIATLGWGVLVAHAAPRYLDREKATELARVLDKGVINGVLITSTFIQGQAAEQFIIKVVLDNGAEQEWDLNQIRSWSQDGSLTLQKNRLLLFPRQTTNDFVVLDKNAFSQQALAARVYAKRYKPGDILSGRVINYSVFAFNLAQLLKIDGGRDEQGYPYDYVFDLENGQRELLSPLDAYEVMTRGGLYSDAAAVSPVLRHPYLLTALRGQELRRIPENGTGEFGVELAFDRDVELEPQHFPFRVYERPRQRRKPFAGNEFILEVTAPNALIPNPIAGIENLEFLKNIRGINDPDHQNRVLLRASVNPEVLTIPPRVQVRNNVVRVVLTKVEDQTVFDRQALRRAELRRRQDKILAGDLNEQEVEKHRRYLEAMDAGRGQVERLRLAEEFAEQAERMREGLALFRSAAANASNDTELQDALRERNALMVKLPSAIVEEVHRQVQQPPVDDPAALQALLDEAAGLTRDPVMLERIRTLRTMVQ